MKTNELAGAALDWAVAKCAWEPERVFLYGEPKKHVRVANRPDISHEYSLSMYYTPSTDWAQGGPLIERNLITIFRHDEEWFAHSQLSTPEDFHGDTPLIAAMRCYVASQLGDEVEIPEELT
jgi:hypothetical protein